MLADKKVALVTQPSDMISYYCHPGGNRIFATDAKTKAQISCAVTAADLPLRIVLFLLYLYPKFQDSSLLL